jgi:hypothetical protein
MQKRQGIPYAGLFTNGSHMDEKTARKVLKSGLDLLVFSLDGLTAAEFERVRAPLKFDFVYQNIIRLCTLKRQTASRRPEVRIQITPVEQDPQEIMKTPAYTELSNIADRVQFTPAPLIHDWTGNVVQLKDVSRAQLPTAPRLPCARLYNTMTVLSDGRVPLCPLDYEGRVELGDLRPQRLTDIWGGVEFGKFRTAHESKRFSELPLCSTCEHRPSWLEWY